MVGRDTSVVAAAHAVAFDAGLASILLAIDDRHAVGQLRPIAVVAPGCGRPSGVERKQRNRAGRAAGREGKTARHSRPWARSKTKRW